MIPIARDTPVKRKIITFKLEEIISISVLFFCRYGYFLEDIRARSHIQWNDSHDKYNLEVLSPG